jgi:hypothetical protein
VSSGPAPQAQRGTKEAFLKPKSPGSLRQADPKTHKKKKEQKRKREWISILFYRFIFIS